MAKRNNKKEEIVVKEIKEEKEEVFKKIENKNEDNTKLKVAMLIAQFFLSIITIAFVITFIFNNNILAPLQISLALTLIVIGINSIIVYKRKMLSVLYFLIGAVLITLAIITILGI